MPRVFVYDGRQIPDPDSSLSVDDVRKRLAEIGIDVPVVEPIHAAVTLARSLVYMRLNHSRIAFPTNRPKERAVPR